MDNTSRTTASARSQFLGTWRLVSSEDRLKDGTARPFKELGPQGVGCLMYAADGHKGDAGPGRGRLIRFSSGDAASAGPGSG